MSVNVYPVASASSVTPINGAFDYNFSTAVYNTTVTVDFTDPVPASTYTISGVTNGGFPVWKIQLLNSSNSMVGEALTTYVSGSYSSNNAGTYTASITASAAFTKIKLIGLNGVQSIQFNSIAPTGAFHIALRPGTRTITARSIFQKIRDAGEGANYSISGVTLPTGYPYAYWIYNAKLYVWWGTVDVSITPSSAVVNTQGIRAYNFATSSWEANIVTFNSSIFGVNTWATLPTVALTTANMAQYVFKNGNVLLRVARLYNTDGTTTQLYGGYSFFFNLSAATVTNKTASVNTAGLLGGALAYSPTADTYYSMGYLNNGVYADRIYKVTNAGVISTVTTSVNTLSQDFGYLWAEDAATPKVAYFAGDSSNAGMQWTSIQSNGTVDTQVTNSTALGSVTLSPLTRMDTRNIFIDADLFGLTNSSFRFQYQSSNPNIIYQDYTYPSSTTLSGTSDYGLFTQTSSPNKATETPFTGTQFTDANGSTLTAYFQPINSTDYAVVFRGTSGTLSSRANIVVCPISSTTQTLV